MPRALAHAFSVRTSFSLQVYRRTAIPGAFLLQIYSYIIILTAVLRLYHHSRCSFIDIGRIAADECEQMCVTNVIDVSYDMTGAQHVLWRTHCCRRTSTTEFRWANVLNECEQMCLTNVNKCAWQMRLTVAMTWLELNMYYGTVGVYQQVLASVCVYIYIYISIYIYWLDRKSVV